MHKDHENYLKTSLIEYFRIPKNHGNWEMAYKIALNQISRTSKKPTINLEKSLLTFATKLKDNISLGSISFFAYEVINHVQTFGFFEEQPSEAFITNNLKKAAFKNIEAMIKNGASTQSALNKTAFVLYKKNIEQVNQKQKSAALRYHPLGNNLHMAKLGTQKLPKEDIRNKLLNLNQSKKGGGVLYELLKKASIFCPHHVRNLLGDELFYLCKPVGFLDKGCTQVLVEVNNSYVLYTLTYKKMEIISLLKRDTNFRKVSNLRFRIMESVDGLTEQSAYFSTLEK